MIDNYSLKRKKILFFGCKSWAHTIIDKISAYTKIKTIGESDLCDISVSLKQDSNWESNINNELKSSEFDGLVNIGMLTNLDGLITTPLDKWKEIVFSNLQLLYKSINVFKEYLKKGASIVNILEIGAMEGLGGGSAYEAFYKESRFLMRNLAETLGDRKIRLNSIRAGYIDTQTTSNENLRKLYATTASSSVLLKEVGTLDELTNAIIFFLSDASRYITGNELFIDGGAHITSYL